jgi:hypothetical protein
LLSKESGLFKPSKAQAQQISTISKERLRDDALGDRLNAALMRTAGIAMRLHPISDSWIHRARGIPGRTAFQTSVCCPCKWSLLSGSTKAAELGTSGPHR